MKKIVILVALLATLASTLSADKVEAVMGMSGSGHTVVYHLALADGEQVRVAFNRMQLRGHRIQKGMPVDIKGKIISLGSIQGVLM